MTLYYDGLSWGLAGDLARFYLLDGPFHLLEGKKARIGIVGGGKFSSALLSKKRRLRLILILRDSWTLKKFSE